MGNRARAQILQLKQKALSLLRVLFYDNARNTVDENVPRLGGVQTLSLLAEGEGFEPPDGCPSTVFKSPYCVYRYRRMSIVIDI